MGTKKQHSLHTHDCIKWFLLLVTALVCTVLTLSSGNRSSTVTLPFSRFSCFLDSNTSYVCKIGFHTAPVTLHLTGVSSQIRATLFSTLTCMEDERNQLRRLAKVAQTPTQIKIAKSAFKRWQAAHHNDLEMNSVLGELSIREALLRIKGEWH
jgi:hypothetical protein